MNLHFVKQMLNFIPEKPLTATQRFTFWSATLTYFMAGLTMILAPDLWNIIFGLELGSRGRGYFFLTAEGVVVIGFCYIVLSRDKSSQIPGHGTILATVMARVLIVNWRLVSLYNQGVTTLSFVLVFMSLDLGLSLITYVIWSREIEGASLKRFFSEIWTVLNPCPTPQRKSAYVIFQLMGYFQFALGLAIAPSFLLSSGIVPKEIFTKHEGGLLFFFLFVFSLHGWFHVLGGGASNHSFMIAALFYRVVWNIPYFLFLGFTSKIEIGLSKVLVSFDVVYSLIILILLLIEKPRVKKN